MKRFLINALVLSLFGSLSSCKEETAVTPAPAALSANAGADQPTTPNQTLVLDGSASTGTGPLTYQWAVVLYS